MLSEEPGVSIVGVASEEVEDLITLIRSSDPDIVILDLDLPGLSTVELLSEVQRINSRLGFIVLGSMPELKEQIILVGVSDSVVKSSPPDELLEAYRRTAGLIRSAAD